VLSGISGPGRGGTGSKVSWDVPARSQFVEDYFDLRIFEGTRVDVRWVMARRTRVSLVV